MKNFILLILTNLIMVSGFSQEEVPNTLTYDKFMTIVRSYHPIAKQADLQINKGEAYVLKSKGGFDPKLNGDLSQKYYDGSRYYSILDANLQIPTWFGIKLQTGYQNTEGNYLNRQNYTPDDGLWYAGISVPLGKGLFIDQRRADLKQAKIYQQISAVEQRKIYNELMYEAGKAFFDWFKAYNKQQIYSEALDIARRRFDAVQQSVEFGDKPAFDTLEAGIQVQSRLFLLEQAKLELKNSAELLSVYLWGDHFVPLELDANITPTSITDFSPTPFDNKYLAKIDTLKMQHPDVLNYQYKLDVQKVEYRLNKENLKPKLDLKYNALSEPIGGNPFTEYSINNYNWGAQLAFPIFARKARGEIKLAEIKLQELENDLHFKTEMIEYKANLATNSWKTTYNQIILFQKTVRDYQLLVEGEQILFNNGESSLFLVNYRESSYIDARLKLIDAMVENQKSKLLLDFSLGLLN